ncbi:MAG: NUDIX hydrolase [Candidatus Marinimicrobia bacterium]|jgi:8-oxo-dGTP pyrophosphatase MutT (NUDIX family)|nr:NUDIX hydrolase [Candidatus Neomarinimicrobiota bacterium]MDP6725938.1 NUDIX hydrolase [Candidatus Neomarinimicrobiota bacterium]|tara:strand:- start:1050 stop:1601 length:552 start_codon:yes stop_codon:yes gene_type:complete
MTQENLQNLFNRYSVQYPGEKTTAQKMIQFLNEDSNCFERHNWYGHFTGSAWVVDKPRERVLMTHHRQLDIWLQLGGHADGCSNLFEVAHMEAIEESGLSQFKALSEEIFDVDIHNIPAHKNDPPHIHFDVRFILEAHRQEEDVIVSDESRDVAWVHIDKVLNKNPEKSIARMLNKTFEFFTA